MRPMQPLCPHVQSTLAKLYSLVAQLAGGGQLPATYPQQQQQQPSRQREGSQALYAPLMNPAGESMYCPVLLRIALYSFALGCVF